MWEVLQSRAFTDWFRGLRDPGARARIVVRIRRLEGGNFGDVKPVGEGVSEIRIDYAGGYRLYFARFGKTLIVLLCAGDKRTQQADIARAKQIVKEL